MEETDTEIDAEDISVVVCIHKIAEQAVLWLNLFTRFQMKLKEQHGMALKELRNCR